MSLPIFTECSDLSGNGVCVVIDPTNTNNALLETVIVNTDPGDVAGYNYLYYSSNTGSTWTSTYYPIPIPVNPGGILGNGIVDINNGNAFFIEGGNSQSIVFSVSYDSGVTWPNGGISPPTYKLLYNQVVTMDGSGNLVCVNPGGQVLLYGNVFTSPAELFPFSFYTISSTTMNYVSMNNQGYAIIATNNGLYYSTADASGYIGSTWQIGAGTDEISFSYVYINGANAIASVTNVNSGGNIFYSSDNGITWYSSVSSVKVPPNTALSMNSSGYAIAGSWYSFNYGQNWAQSSYITSSGRGVSFQSAFSCVTLDPYSAYVLAAPAQGSTYTGLWYSSNNGQLWQQITDPALQNVNSIALQNSQAIVSTSANGVWTSDLAGSGNPDPTMTTVVLYYRPIPNTGLSLVSYSKLFNDSKGNEIAGYYFIEELKNTVDLSNDIIETNMTLYFGNRIVKYCYVSRNNEPFNSPILFDNLWNAQTKIGYVNRQFLHEKGIFKLSVTLSLVLE